jgi:hypothetical protein
VSATTSAPWSCAAAVMAGTFGWRTPVLVSAWTNPTTSGSWRSQAAATSSGSSGSPHGASTSWTSPPARSAIDAIRPPK